MKIDHDFESMFSKCHKYKLTLTIVNNFENLKDFLKEIENTNFADKEFLRPQWDTYFMRIAHQTSLRSNCMKRNVGAVIVVQNRIVSTGYNGTPSVSKNCNEGGCERCNSNTKGGKGLDECICIHAEENAIIESGR